MKTYVEITLTVDISGLGANDAKLYKKLDAVLDVVHEMYLEQVPLDSPNDRRTIFERPMTVYPEGVTKQELENYMNTHPEEGEYILDHYTAVQRKGDGFVTVPYTEVYGNAARASELLAEAADVAKAYPKFQAYLLALATAFKNNDWYSAHVAWTESFDAPLFFLCGPCEEYIDQLFGVKRAFQGMVGITNHEKNEMVNTFRDHLIGFDAYLGKKHGYTPHGIPTKMIAIDVVRGAGELANKPPAAFALPNDTAIQEQHGSVQVFLSNYIGCKYNLIAKPLYERILTKESAHSIDETLNFELIVGHETAHCVSFRFKDPVGLGQYAHEYEEAKADIYGLYLWTYLVREGLLPEGQDVRAIILEFATGVRQLKGGAVSHARGKCMQWNWAMEQGAFAVEDNVLVFDREKIVEANISLADAFYEIWKKNDFANAEAFVEKYARGKCMQWNWAMEQGAFAVEDNVLVFDREKIVEANISLADAFYEIWKKNDFANAEAFVEKYARVPSEIESLLEHLSDIPDDADMIIKVKE